MLGHTTQPDWQGFWPELCPNIFQEIFQDIVQDILILVATRRLVFNLFTRPHFSAEVFLLVFQKYARTFVRTNFSIFMCKLDYTTAVLKRLSHTTEECDVEIV